MEEYIDKNKLIRDLIDNRSFYPAIVKNAIGNAPIEDVVPRSEIEKAKQDVTREILHIIDSITGAEYDNHNEIEVAFMQGAKRVREKIIKKYNITEQPITKDRNT